MLHDEKCHFRVVGSRSDGARTVVSSHATREAAEHVLTLIRFGSDFKEFHIEQDGEQDGEEDGEEVGQTRAAKGVDRVKRRRDQPQPK